MKFNMSAGNLRNTAFLQSSKYFNVVKDTIEPNRKLKSKYLNTSIPMNADLSKIIKINKVRVLFIKIFNLENTIK